MEPELNAAAIDDGEIESAHDTAESRVREQEPWLRLLPMDFETILDVGAGAGFHSKWFLDRGKQPVALDRYGQAFAFGDTIELIRKDLSELDGSRQFDAVFCSHVLEHFPDPASGLLAMRALLKPGGYLFAIVPPYAPLVVNYHWHTGWNCSQLAMLMVSLGFDCASATFMQVGGNVCGWGRKTDIGETKFNLRRSLPFLPQGMRRSFYQRAGYDFLPGDLVFADPRRAHIAPTELQFEIPDFEFSAHATLSYDEEGWKSHEIPFAAPGIDLSNDTLRLVVALEGETPQFRLAVGSGRGADPWQDAAERGFSVCRGINCFAVRPEDFRVLRGEPDFRAVRQVSIGGIGRKASLRIWFTFPNVQA